MLPIWGEKDPLNTPPFLLFVTLNEVKGLAFQRRDSSASPQNDKAKRGNEEDEDISYSLAFQTSEQEFPKLMFLFCHPELVSGSNSLSCSLKYEMLKQVQHDKFLSASFSLSPWNDFRIVSGSLYFLILFSRYCGVFILQQGTILKLKIQPCTYNVQKSCQTKEMLQR